jgi:hypothetical protein
MQMRMIVNTGCAYRARPVDPRSNGECSGRWERPGGWTRPSADQTGFNYLKQYDAADQSSGKCRLTGAGPACAVARRESPVVGWAFRHVGPSGPQRPLRSGCGSCRDPGCEGGWGKADRRKSGPGNHPGCRGRGRARGRAFRGCNGRFVPAFHPDSTGGSGAGDDPLSRARRGGRRISHPPHRKVHRPAEKTAQVPVWLSEIFLPAGRGPPCPVPRRGEGLG